MNLYKADICSGSVAVIFADAKTVYVVAKDYRDAETEIIKNAEWEWPHGRRILCIEQIFHPVLVSREIG